MRKTLRISSKSLHAKILEKAFFLTKPQVLCTFFIFLAHSARSEVVELFRKCSGMPDVVQLDMDLYIYSFGFKNLLSTWKAAIHRYQTGMYHYSHGLQSYHRLKGILLVHWLPQRTLVPSFFHYLTINGCARVWAGVCGGIFRIPSGD